jgi:hypothetical protein
MRKVLGDLDREIVAELRRVRKAETLGGFPQLIILPDGTSPPALSLHHMPIEAKPTLELTLDLARGHHKLIDAEDLPTAPSLVELPRRVLVAPAVKPRWVFDRIGSVLDYSIGS